MMRKNTSSHFSFMGRSFTWAGAKEEPGRFGDVSQVERLLHVQNIHKLFNSINLSTLDISLLCNFARREVDVHLIRRMLLR